jgi:Na+/alanine symporter
MAFPNIAGVILLTDVIKADLDDYLDRLRAGLFVRHEAEL